MIGKKLYKGQYTNKEYAETAIWCNSNNAHIEDKGEYYKVVANVPYVPTNEQKVIEYERQIEVLNNKIVRDLIILNDVNSSAEEKSQAQTYFNNKMVEKNKLIEKINELKNR